MKKNQQSTIELNDRIDLLLQQSSELKDLSSLYEINEKNLKKAEDQTEFIVSWLPDGSLSTANESYCNYMGLSQNNLIGKSFFSLLSIDSQKSIEKKIKSLTPKNRIISDILQVIKPDGSIGWNQWVTRAFYDSNDNIIELHSVGKDITELKQALLALEKSEKKYRTLVTNIPDVMWTTDKNGTITFISSNIEKIYGYTPDEIYQGGEELWSGRIHPEDVDKAKIAFNTLTKKENKFDIEYRIKHKNGNWIWLHERALRTYDDHGNIRIDGILSDITERKQAEKALMSSEEKYRVLVENATEGISVVQDGKYQFLNKKTLEISGRSTEEFSNIEFAKYVHPDDKELVIQNYQKRLKGEPVSENFNFRIYHKSGEIRWVKGKAVRIIWEGKPATMQFHYDNTEQKLAEEALKISEERYRKLVENANEGIVVVQDGIIKYINKKGIEIGGFIKQEIIDTSFLKQVHPDDIEIVKQNYINRMKDEPVPPNYHFRLIQKSGEIRWLNGNGVKISWDGEPASLHFLNDITEQKLAEDDLKSSEERYRKLVENALEGILVIQDGKIKFQNKKTSEIAGFPDKIPKDYNLFSDVHHNDREFIKEIYKKRLNGKPVPDNYDIRIIRKSGEIRFLTINAISITWDHKPAILYFLNDHTEKKLAKDALQSTAEKLKIESDSLIKKNIALNEILDHLKQEKDNFKNELSSNVENLLKPFIDKLHKNEGRLKEKDIALFENHINSITGKDIDQFLNNYNKLSPRELDICEKIRAGMSSKEIANSLNISLDTVNKHRESIRTKLQLKHKTINLSAYLRSR